MAGASLKKSSRRASQKERCQVQIFLARETGAVFGKGAFAREVPKLKWPKSDKDLIMTLEMCLGSPESTG